MSRHRKSLSVAVATIALASIAVGAAFVFISQGEHRSFALDTLGARDKPAPPPEALKNAENLSGAFKHAAAVIRPSVVSIRSTKVFKAQPRGEARVRPEQELPEEFRNFFGDDFLKRFGGDPFRGGIPFHIQPHGEMRQQGEGTGVIVSDDGYIVTNNHVVDGADEVQVQLVDGRAFDAKVVGADAKTDVAVVKIEASHLTPAALGDSDAIEVGDWVVAVGSPFGLEHTVTTGIVSAKGRANVGIVEYEDFIQTDAAINPGNSGGPLVNLHGEVIGINTAIASRSGSFAGIGFSIPMTIVRSVVQDILDDGAVERGWLGAAIQDLNEDLAASFHYNSTEGVLVGQVVPGSPAEKAGLKAGDIIVELNGRRERNANSLRNQVARTKPDTKAPMVVVRDGKRVKLNVTLGLLDEQHVASISPAAHASAAAPKAESKLGVTVSAITPQLAERYGLDEAQTGVLVTAVDAGSLADRSGLQAGDVLLSINGVAIKDAEHFAQIAKEVDPAKGVRLHASSKGFQRFLFLKQR